MLLNCTKRIISTLLFSALVRVGHSQDASATPTTAVKRSNDGLGTTVEWDPHSLILNGKRLYNFGGEFHTFRIPVPELWVDILEKIKAMGMNSVSMYTHWGLQAPNATTLDFSTGAHNLAEFYKYAKDVGIFVTARPGPYINAELSAGGLPLWITTGGYGALRNNDTRYTAAWTPFMSKMANIIQPYLVSQNGTVLLWQIENEFPNQWSNAASKTPVPTSIAYNKNLEANARANGIDIPFTANMPSTNGKAWSTDYDTVGAGGDVNIYGLDSYPTCWSCIPTDCSTSNPTFTLLNYYDHFQGVSPSQPPMIPEFQGGALNPWNGPAGGCENKSGVDFMNVYLRDNVAQKIVILSLYMIFGGTNWGWLSVPFVPTSYDYGAAIAEDRSLRDKFYEIKLLGLFTRAAEELPGTSRIGSGSNYTDNTDIFTTELYDAVTDARFYVTRHKVPTSSANETFHLNVTTSIGNFSVPQKGGGIALNGYISKIIPVDFHFGNETLFYSTAEVLTYGIFDDIPTIALWLPSGEIGELYVKGATSGSVVGYKDYTSVKFDVEDSGLIISFQQNKGMSVIKLDNGIRILTMNRRTGWGTWVPGLTNDPTVPVDNTVIVMGPHLVRSAELFGSTLSITGDSNSSAVIEVFAPAAAKTLIWNGVELDTQPTSYGSLKSYTPKPARFANPTFGTWKAKNSLPEKALNYSDSGIAWVNANHMTTLNPTKTATKPYLFVDEYGFHAGIHLWRGYFNGSSNISGAYLQLQGGKSFGYSVFLNGDLVGSWFGDPSSTTGTMTLSFANATVNTGSNVLFVIQDNSGHDEQASGALNVRGILNATLLGSSSSSFGKWKVAGSAGGAFNTTIDPVRSYYNEGGLTAERLGWHLPDFDDADWEVTSPSIGFDGADVMFYRTTMNLDVPTGMDVALAFTIAPVNQSVGGAAPTRALLYVNGYQYGRFNPHIRETNPYPVPPGILNYAGTNTIALAVWSQTVAGAAFELSVETSYVLESSLDVLFDGDYLRPGWTSERLKYA